MAKRKTGRPLIVPTPEEFERRATAYFDGCNEANVPYTVTGLALALGLASLQSLWEYKHRPEFSEVVKKAMLYVEHSYELRLQESRPTGAIFWLKNHGWTDRREVKHSGHVMSHNMAALSDGELKHLRDLLTKTGTNGSTPTRIAASRN